MALRQLSCPSRIQITGLEEAGICSDFYQIIRHSKYLYTYRRINAKTLEVLGIIAGINPSDFEPSDNIGPKWIELYQGEERIDLLKYLCDTQIRTELQLTQWVGDKLHPATAEPAPRGTHPATTGI